MKNVMISSPFNILLFITFSLLIKCYLLGQLSCIYLLANNNYSNSLAVYLLVTLLH